jgi:subtilisin family serine protease
MSILLVLSLLSLAFGLLDLENLDQPYVPDEYIITYHESTTDEEATAHWSLMDSVGIEFIHKYNAGGHKGFAAKITNEKVVAALREDPMVSNIQVNGIVHINQHSCDVVQQNCPSWGLARLSHLGDVSRGLINNMRHSASHDGAGVDIYIIDTGIMITHNDFGGRARWGVAYADGGTQDDRNGHGTHCAGTAAGSTYGIAKRANLVAVKVLSASGGGTWADVIAGVDYLANNGAPGRSLGSMSLGGGGSNAGLTSAVNNCVNKGIPVIVAAGNSNANACGYTPSGIPSVISVGATEIAGFEPDEFDNRASFSNWGTCVHIFAPGRDITSSWIGSNTASSTISGTSMACPHVAGYAATLLSNNPDLSPQALKDLLQTTAQKDIIANPGTGSPNMLLYNQCDHQ